MATLKKIRARSQPSWRGSRRNMILNMGDNVIRFQTLSLNNKSLLDGIYTVTKHKVPETKGARERERSSNTGSFHTSTQLVNHSVKWV